MFIHKFQRYVLFNFMKTKKIQFLNFLKTKTFSTESLLTVLKSNGFFLINGFISLVLTVNQGTVGHRDNITKNLESASDYILCDIMFFLVFCIYYRHIHQYYCRYAFIYLLFLFFISR